ncbi:uncharacterized protein LOC130727827 isoform X2 [Lotus japonicus]|uniref:uncharacterized protein LOC130727827 isoform X2 n=1 Tax=Lotus japonicus TaxID=34305 RepID=UPI00258A8EBF|nr:uncharacterized protein LOC130727827 isoform X2 [Lotus japonicus]
MPITLREKEVAEILVDLPALIFKFDRARGFPFTWGCKKRRSAINVSPYPSPRHHHHHPPPPPPLKAEVSSPATPLSFSPSESDDNNNNNPSVFRRNVSLKRKREHYLNVAEVITKDNELLQGEIQTVKSYLQRLKDFNSKLKTKKRELIVGSILQHSGTAEHRPLVVRQTAEPPRVSDGDGAAARGKGTTSLGDSTSGDVGPSKIPDLNMPCEEEEEERVAVEVSEEAEASTNLCRTMAAAQARHNRLQIQRVKNPIGSNKNRYSFR